MGLNRSSIHRKLKTNTGKSVSQFIRETRLQHAYKLLQEKKGTVSEISYQVGFGSPTYFNKCFHDYYQISPGDVLKDKPLPGNESTTYFFSKKVNLEKLYLYLSFLAVVLLGFIVTTDKIEARKKTSENILTRNDAALNYYLKGLDFIQLYERDRDFDFIFKAKESLYNAIENDSTFANAWLKLATVYINHLCWYQCIKNWILYNNRLDTGIVLLNKAIDLHTTYPDEELLLLTKYYQNKGMTEKAQKNFEKYVKNQNTNYLLYDLKGNYYHFNSDYYNALKNWFLYLKLLPSDKLPRKDRLGKMMNHLRYCGFPELAKEYAKELFAQYSDTTMLKIQYIGIDYYAGKYEVARNRLMKLYLNEKENELYTYRLMCCNIMLNDHVKAFNFLQNTLSLREKQNIKVEPDVYMGYLYQRMGLYKEADWHLKNGIKNDSIFSEIYIPYIHQPGYYAELAGYYSLLNDSANAFKALSHLSERETIPLPVLLQLKYAPFYDDIRYLDEFKKVIADLEIKYAKEHNRVYRLLKSEGMVR